MGGLVTLLLIAGLFYFMMRFGCGAHAVHGHGSGHGSHAGHGDGQGALPQGDPATDPVCGMEVAPGQGYAKIYEGREYRLCSRACLDKFDASPDQFVTVQGGA